MVEAASAQAAAMVVVMVVQLSPSPQSHPSVLPEEAIKKESHPASPLETLKFDLNLYPFMVLWNTDKYVQEESWISQKSDSWEFLKVNMADNTQGPSQWARQKLFSFFLHWHPRYTRKKRGLDKVLKLSNVNSWYVLYCSTLMNFSEIRSCTLDGQDVFSWCLFLHLCADICKGSKSQTKPDHWSIANLQIWSLCDLSCIPFTFEQLGCWLALFYCSVKCFPA